jgi:hypothetical protein
VKKVCCVCGKDLGEVPGPADRVTHGFCEACYRSELRAWTAHFDAKGTAPTPPATAESSPA